MNAKKIFLAAPFKGLMNQNTGVFCTEMRSYLECLINFLTVHGFSVHNAHQRENWGKNFMTPDECTQLDYQEISECHYFLAFPGSPASPGTHIELGWASALKKKIILFLEKNKTYAYLVTGLHTVTDISYIYYNTKDHPQHLIDKLSDEMNLEKEMV